LEEFRKIVEKVRPGWEKLQQKKKVSGRNSHLKTLEDEILLVLIFYRFYVTHEFLGYLFGLDNSNICRHLKKIEPLLCKNLAIKKDRTLSADNLTNLPHKKKRKTPLTEEEKAHNRALASKRVLIEKIQDFGLGLQKFSEKTSSQVQYH
jgi:hypothetical protein